MTTAKVSELVINYLNDEFNKLGSKNKMTCEMVHGGEPWVVSLL
jgi:Cys-Gly metallodipeptidase DUG1